MYPIPCVTLIISLSPSNLPIMVFLAGPQVILSSKNTHSPDSHIFFSLQVFVQMPPLNDAFPQLLSRRMNSPLYIYLYNLVSLLVLFSPYYLLSFDIHFCLLEIVFLSVFFSTVSCNSEQCWKYC